MALQLRQDRTISDSNDQNWFESGLKLQKSQLCTGIFSSILSPIHDRCQLLGFEFGGRIIADDLGVESQRRRFCFDAGKESRCRRRGIRRLSVDAVSLQKKSFETEIDTSVL